MSADSAVMTGSQNDTTCPLCHTEGPNIEATQLRAGVSWRCRRCGQSWDVARLRAVAAYASYCAGEAAARRN